RYPRRRGDRADRSGPDHWCRTGWWQPCRRRAVASRGSSECSWGLLLSGRGKAEDVRGLVVQGVVAAEALGHRQRIGCALEELGQHQIVEREARAPGGLDAQIACRGIGL